RSHLHRLLIDRGVSLPGEQDDRLLTVEFHRLGKQVDAGLCTKAIINKVQMKLLRGYVLQGRIVVIAPLDFKGPVLYTVDKSTGQDEVIFIIVDNANSYGLRRVNHDS